MTSESKESIKITIIGTGFVGTTTAFTLLVRGMATEILLIDKNRQKAEGEAMDLRHGLSTAYPTNIFVGDYPDAAGSDIVIIAAGSNRIAGHNRLDMTAQNLEIIKDIAPNLGKHCPEAVLLIATNPVDVITYAAWKLSGLPSSKVLGSGTVLDSSRFRQALSVHCGVDPKNIHAYIIGEHGDSQVPLWSLTNIGGVSIDEFCILSGNNCVFPDKEGIDNKVRNAGYDIISRKGATYYGIALALCRIVEAVLRDENAILTVSSLIQGQYGVYDVCLSLPTIVNRNGIGSLIELPLNNLERQAFRESAEVIKKYLRVSQLTEGAFVT